MIQYSIFDNDNEVGQVTIQKEGLYCRLHGWFAVKNPECCRLMCYGGETSRDLGCGFPSGRRWELKRFFPWHYLPNRDLRFVLVSGIKKEIRQQKLVPGEQIERICTLPVGKLHYGEDGYWVLNADEL